MELCPFKTIHVYYLNKSIDLLEKWQNLTTNLVSQWIQLHLIFFIEYEFWQIYYGLHFLLISFMLVKFPKDQILIVISSIKCLNFKFCVIKLCTKNKLIDWIVNNKINFGNKLCYSLGLKLYLISFYWVWILTNPP